MYQIQYKIHWEDGDSFWLNRGGEWKEQDDRFTSFLDNMEKKFQKQAEADDNYVEGYTIRIIQYEVDTIFNPIMRES